MTSIRWRTEKLRIGLIIALFLSQLAFEHFGFQNEAAFGDDFLALFHPLEHLHAPVLLQPGLNDALFEFRAIERDKHDLIPLHRFAAPCRG